MIDLGTRLSASVQGPSGAEGAIGIKTPERREGPGASAGPAATFRDSLAQATLPSLNVQGPIANAASSSVGAQALKFSNHAIDRMRSRGIQFSPEQLQKIDSAVEKVKAKGGKETLMLTPNSALIVNIANKTIVTVMDNQNLKENVFTNIDSTIVI